MLEDSFLMIILRHMKRTCQLIQDMRQMRRDIIDIYDQELCDWVSRSNFEELSAELKNRRNSLATLHARVGLDIHVS